MKTTKINGKTAMLAAGALCMGTLGVASSASASPDRHSHSDYRSSHVTTRGNDNRTVWPSTPAFNSHDRGGNYDRGRYYDRGRHYDDHDNTGNVIAGVVIGAVIGGLLSR